MPRNIDQAFITTVTDAIPSMIAYWDKDLRCRFANKAYLDWFGRQPQSLLGETMRSLLGDRLFTLNEPYIKAALAGDAQNFQRELTRADGRIGHTWANYVPHFGDDARVRGFFVLVSDVTPLREAERRIEESEARYRLLAEHGTDLVFQLDRELVCRYVSPSCREILGYAPDDLIGSHATRQHHPEDAEQVKQILQALIDGHSPRDRIISRLRHREGHWVWVEATIRALHQSESPLPTGIIGSLRDISGRKAVETELEKVNRRLQALAGTDGLTGLANRRGFDEVLAREYRRARRNRTGLSLIMIDVDHFKAFNDHYGHPEGDESLRRVAKAIRATLRRPGDLAARYGGEEFGVILPDTNEAAAVAIAEELRRAVLRIGLPHRGTPSGLLSISCGVASAECCESDAAVLIEQADLALYLAKRNGRNSVARANPAASNTCMSSANA
jgi:diguanylate cyclase (GGDEF)-like protein/PAS domain S-box-containing protein